MKDDVALLVIIAFLVGLLIGEYRTCSSENYSLDTGCRVEK